MSLATYLARSGCLVCLGAFVGALVNGAEMPPRVIFAVGAVYFFALWRAGVRFDENEPPLFANIVAHRTVRFIGLTLVATLVAAGLVGMLTR